MLSEPYQDWVSLFNDEIKVKWGEEKPELKKIAMLYCAFEAELNRIKTGLTEEVLQIRAEIKQRDFLRKCKNFSGLAQSERFIDAFDTNKDKENETPPIEPLGELNMNEELIIESPDTCRFFVKTPLQAKCATSPILKKNTLLKRKSSASPSLLFPSKGKKIDKTPNICDETNILEATIIEDTPDLKSTRKSKLSLQKSRKRRKDIKCPQKKHNSTLTQMFLEPRKEKEIDSNLPSMSITEMLDLINKNDSDDTDAELSDATVDCLDVAVVDNKEKNNLASYVANYDKLPDKKTKEPGFVYNEVVRGKERKKLKGWSCNECENYYKALNLPPDELEKKKDACSKHRHRFKPREETYAGFWDLTFGPTPQS